MAVPIREALGPPNGHERTGWSLWAVAFLGATLSGCYEDQPSPLFVDANAGLFGLSYASLAWGDYDSDGDLDLVVAGEYLEGSSGLSCTKLYRNEGGESWSDIDADLVDALSGSLAWGDYDGDGDLDLGLAKWGNSFIYCNQGAGSFADADAGLEGAFVGSLAWGDYDNDGDPDLALAGYSPSGRISKVYRNEVGAFVDIGASLPGVVFCSLAWGDYDNDGDLDLALSGQDSSDVSEVYRNEGGGVFTDIDAGLQPGWMSSLAWGDYDNDGDLDLALAAGWSHIYRNDGGGTFTDIGAGVIDVWSGSLAWGDYDNDGDLDLAIAGSDPHGSGDKLAKMYRNDGGGVFTEVPTWILPVTNCSLSWGDYDDDGDLDLAVAGGTDSGRYTRIYRNDGGTFNAAPAAPDGLSAGYTGSDPYDVTFSWDASADAETPQPGLTYNLRVGTTSGGNEVFPGMADVATGLRRVPARGAVQPGVSVNEWTLALPADTYYWSVQAIDTAFCGSPWAPEETVTVP